MELVSKRQPFLLVIVFAVVCVFSAMALIYTKHESRKLFVELEGLTQKKAAERLGISLSGIKSRVQRGRRKLKHELLSCCNVALDRRRGVVAYEVRQQGSCGCTAILQDGRSIA